MKTLKLGICFIDEEDNIISKRVIGTNWEVNIEEARSPSTHVKTEISTILSEDLKLKVDADMIEEMLNEVK